MHAFSLPARPGAFFDGEKRFINFSIFYYTAFVYRIQAEQARGRIRKGNENKKSARIRGFAGRVFGGRLFSFAFVNQEIHVIFQLRQHCAGECRREPQHGRGIGDGRRVIGNSQQVVNGHLKIFRNGDFDIIRRFAFISFIGGNGI